METKLGKRIERTLVEWRAQRLVMIPCRQISLHTQHKPRNYSQGRTCERRTRPCSVYRLYAYAEQPPAAGGCHEGLEEGVKEKRLRWGSLNPGRHPRLSQPSLQPPPNTAQLHQRDTKQDTSASQRRSCGKYVRQSIANSLNLG